VRYERSSVRITVRFKPSEVERIDAALDRARSKHSFGYRPDRSALIHAAVELLLTKGATRYPAEPSSTRASDSAGPTASDIPGVSDVAGKRRP
jgi:hypothetical protein